jgi:hypothetical protein
MKHKFNAVPLVLSIRTLGSEEGNVPRRKLPDGKRAAFHTEIGAPQREIENRAATMKFL